MKKPKAAKASDKKAKAKKAEKKPVKQAAKPVAKKPAPKKPAPKAKPVAKKAAKPAAKKPVAKAKPAAKKVAKPVAKAKPAAKKPMAKAKPVAKKVVKAVAKKAEVKPVAKKAEKVAAKTEKVVHKSNKPSKLAQANSGLKPIITSKPAVKVRMKLESKPAVEKPTLKDLIKVQTKKVDPKAAMAQQHAKSVAENASKVDDRTSYSKEELEEFRLIIEEKLEEARQEYSVQQDSLKNTTEVAADGYNLTEFGSEMSDREQAEMLLSRTGKFINALERALVRIENGSYGRCKITGKLIPKERLKLVPHTETSIEAKLQQNTVVTPQYPIELYERATESE